MMPGKNWRWFAIVTDISYSGIVRGDKAEVVTYITLLDDIGLARYEDLSAQILHKGPYKEEAATIAKLSQFIAEQAYEPAGKHHEIYLGGHENTATV